MFTNLIADDYYRNLCGQKLRAEHKVKAAIRRKKQVLGLKENPLENPQFKECKLLNNREIYIKNLPHRAIAVNMYLRDRTGKDGSCFPVVSTIAADLKMSKGRKGVFYVLN